jgi:uncharacterized protein (DUF1501 family)
MSKPRDFNADRRRFLRSAAAAGVAGAALNPWLQLQAMAQTASGSDYKALVCLFLYGGNDANNMLMPHEPDQYALYAKARQALALSNDPRAGEMLPIVPSNPGARRLAMHGALPMLKRRFDEGRLAWLANIGTLVEPVSKDRYARGLATLPLGLFSHADQQSQWQTDSYTASLKGGWGGRMLDTVRDAAATHGSYACVSVASGALWGTNADATLLPYRVPPDGRFGLQGYTPAGGTQPQDAFSRAMDEMLAQGSSEIFGRAWLSALQRAMDNQRVLSGALNQSPLKTVFPDSGLGHQLKMVAQLIQARGPLGLRRQCFFSAMGGFDTHGDGQLAFQATSFAEMDAAIDAFWRALDEMGLSNQVTLFTASDFNRTLVSNGKGSDHAWGSHQLVLGGAVRGGRLYGEYPSMALDGPSELGNGVFVPGLSLDHLGVELGKWFGAGSALSTVFPNMGRFTHDLGLMAV